MVTKEKEKKEEINAVSDRHKALELALTQIEKQFGKEYLTVSNLKRKLFLM